MIVSVCLSVRSYISETTDRTLPNTFCVLLVTVTRSCYGVVANLLRCVMHVPGVLGFEDNAIFYIMGTMENKNGIDFLKHSVQSLLICYLLVWTCVTTGRQRRLQHRVRGTVKTPGDCTTNMLCGKLLWKWKSSVACWSLKVLQFADQNRSQAINWALSPLHTSTTEVSLVQLEYSSSSSSSSFISDTRSIGITIKQHIGQTGNIQKYTQKGISYVNKYLN